MTRTIHLSEIESDKEREILQLLDKKKKCLYGDIIRSLSISSNEGQKIIFSMLSKGLIKHQENSFYLVLNVKFD